MPLTSVLGGKSEFAAGLTIRCTCRRTLFRSSHSSRPRPHVRHEMEGKKKTPLSLFLIRKICNLSSRAQTGGSASLFTPQSTRTSNRVNVLNVYTSWYRQKCMWSWEAAAESQKKQQRFSGRRWRRKIDVISMECGTRIISLLSM